MKFFLASVTILVWAGMGVWAWSQAALESTVSATVQVQSLSVAVTDGSVAYGVLAASATQDTFTLGASDRQVVDNDGNATINVEIRGATTDAWDLKGTAGTDIFVHRFASDDAGNAYQVLTDSNILFKDSLDISATHPLDLEIQVPSSDTSGGSLQTADVTVVAVSP